MRPILFKIYLSGSLPFYIPAYGTMLTIGFLCAIFLASTRARSINLKPSVVLELCYLTFCGGVIGARVLHVALNFEQYWSSSDNIISAGGIVSLLWNAVTFWKGGLTFFGGLVGGIATILIFARVKKIPGLCLLDLLAPPTALGLAVTRLGCFLNGCCFGNPTDASWGVHFPSNSHAYFHQIHLGLIDMGDRPLAVHPTQLYELMAALVIFFYLWGRYTQRRFTGAIFFTFGLLYCAWRFVSEFWRADSSVWNMKLYALVMEISPLNIYQLLSIVLFLALIPPMLWALRQPKQP